MAGMDAAVTWGLLGAWVVHDAEELLTMPAWSAARVPDLRRRHPAVPERVWRVMSADRAEAAASIGVVGVLVAGAAAAGAATGGRSPFYQAVLVGFGVHAVSHVAFSVLARAYTPGVVTAVGVVAPFASWAWRRLSTAGVSGAVGTADAVATIASLPVVLGSARVIGRRLAPRMRRSAP
jgi:hypothetical protein